MVYKAFYKTAEGNGVVKPLGNHAKPEEAARNFALRHSMSSITEVLIGTGQTIDRLMPALKALYPGTETTKL